MGKGYFVTMKNNGLRLWVVGCCVCHLVLCLPYQNVCSSILFSYPDILEMAVIKFGMRKHTKSRFCIVLLFAMCPSTTHVGT